MAIRPSWGARSPISFFMASWTKALSPQDRRGSMVRLTAAGTADAQHHQQVAALEGLLSNEFHHHFTSR